MATQTGQGSSTRRQRTTADEALDQLAVATAAAAQRLEHLTERLRGLKEMRGRIDGWIATVDEEDRPLIVEEIGDVLDELNRASARFRRSQARALAAEGATHERIAGMFGVSRQRVSTLLSSDD